MVDSHFRPIGLEVNEVNFNEQRSQYYDTIDFCNSVRVQARIALESIDSKSWWKVDRGDIGQR